jgi:hypothetical protein
MKRLLALLLMLALLLALSVTAAAEDGEAPGAFTVDTKIHDVIDHPAFNGFGRLLFPTLFDIPARLPIKELYYLLPAYHTINPENAAEVLNYLKDQSEAGNQVFYDIYTAEEKAADPAKADTGLFFFRGDPGAKFAVLSSGMAFRYVGAIHDSFPQALELSKRGYNAFTLIFRPGKITGTEDLARAIDFIFAHADELGVNTADYSIWGGSSGAHFAVWYTENGAQAFGGQDHGRPAIIVTQYTASYELSGNDVPTYANLGDRDLYCQANEKDRIAKLQAQGIDAQLDLFEGCWHGFGLGIGTAAEGWVDNAVAFWQRHMTS